MAADLDQAWVRRMVGCELGPPLRIDADERLAQKLLQQWNIGLAADPLHFDSVWQPQEVLTRLAQRTELADWCD